MRRLVLVRHGESVWNAQARIQGQRCAGLTEVGHAQARAIAVGLADAYPQAELVTSDLQRTRETVAPLEQALGRPARHEPALRERDFGAWEGRLRADVRSEEADRVRRWTHGEDVVPEVGGESSEQLGDRVVPVLLALLDGTPDGGVTVAVTHGGPIWYGTHRVLGLDHGTLGSVANGSVTELLGWSSPDQVRRRGVGPTPQRGRVVLERWNELAHLPVELRTGLPPRQSSDAPPVGR